MTVALPYFLNYAMHQKVMTPSKASITNAYFNRVYSTLFNEPNVVPKLMVSLVRLFLGRNFGAEGRCVFTYAFVGGGGG